MFMVFKGECDYETLVFYCEKNRYGETIAVTTGIVKAETMEEAENIVDKDFGSDYSYGLTIDEVEEHEKIYAYTVYKHVFN